MLVRRIANEEDLTKFTNSSTHDEVLEFILALNAAAADQTVGFAPPISSGVDILSRSLDNVLESLERHPAKPTKSRFGKPEFVGFVDDIEDSTPSWMSGLSSNSEIHQYFVESFGNRNRLDYGSGHELSFICCLLSLSKLGHVSRADDRNLVLGIFPKYLRVMRKIQQTYWLEPAGSHGVWGLDDYHFLPYLFGSGQLVNDRYLRPIHIHDQDIVAMYEEQNLYFWCISFIDRVKTASLRWHSPMLDDISGVKRWSKVNEGMIKMYKAEVLGKLPIVQHFLFGKVLPAPEGVTAADAVGSEVHLHCWADCCGIRVPSAIAANESEAGRGNYKGTGHYLKRSAAVPVD